MAHGETKTSINLKTPVFVAAKERAKNLGIDFGELVELSLQRDQAEKMAILRTEDKIVYAPIEEPEDPIDELIAYLDEFERRCEDQRWLGAKFRVGVLKDIAADVRRWRDEVKRKLAESKISPALEAVKKATEEAMAGNPASPDPQSPTKKPSRSARK